MYFREKRLCKKSVKFCSTIHRNNLKTMANLSESTPSKLVKQIVNEMTLNEK